ALAIASCLAPRIGLTLTLTPQRPHTPPHLAVVRLALAFSPHVGCHPLPCSNPNITSSPPSPPPPTVRHRDHARWHTRLSVLSSVCSFFLSFLLANADDCSLAANPCRCVTPSKCKGSSYLSCLPP